jgi:hypothetical protein
MKYLKACRKGDIFDMGCQISDDVKNGKFKNGFVIYMCGDSFSMASTFEDKESIIPSALNMAQKIERFINDLIYEAENPSKRM